MEENHSESSENIVTEEKPKSRLVLFVSFGSIVLLALILGGLVVYGKTYEDRVFPNVRIGEIQFGGMTKDEVKSYLDTMNDKFLSEGFRLSLQDNGQEVTSVVLPAEVLNEADSFSYVELDTEAQADSLVHLGKSNNSIVNGFKALPKMSYWNLTLEHLSLQSRELEEAIAAKISPYQIVPQNARLEITSINPFKYTIREAQSGRVYNTSQAVSFLQNEWSVLESPAVTLIAENITPTVQKEDVEKVVNTVPEFLQSPITLTFTEPDTKVEKTWTLTPRTLATLLTVEKRDTPVVTLDFASTTEYLTDVVEKDIAIEPQNAKFLIDENGKVKEFQGARTGVGLDVALTFERLKDAFELQRGKTDPATVEIAVKEVDPSIKTGEVNDLGIKEVLGVGISNFSGSPANRIKNIRNAVVKLNGILIKPGEEFSAIKYTQPYTLEGGYLPEKVIKGDKITPEIGGGLCQVGTTLFRMAMNSGLEITERRNHSLVVSYYNDAATGLPGTDATIYEPSPDFRFKNDTDSYILIQTDMNEKTGELRFTLWGTNDGRKGYYSRPVVHSWIPAGPSRVIETTSLPPGKKECQHAFPGANTSFTYTREMPDGTKQDEVFESHYRALPEICLVGVEATTPTCTEGEVCSAPESVDSSSPTQPEEAVTESISPSETTT